MYLCRQLALLGQFIELMEGTLFLILLNLYFTKLWNGKLHTSENFMQFVFILNHTSHKFSQI
jgi:hypothetical protein